SVRRCFERTAHLFEAPAKPDIALKRVERQMAYRHVASRNRRCRPEVAGGRRIRFDDVVRPAITFRGRNFVAQRTLGIARLMYLDAERFHYALCHCYIRLRDEWPIDIDPYGFARERSGHQ